MADIMDEWSSLALVHFQGSDFVLYIELIAAGKHDRGRHDANGNQTSAMRGIVMSGWRPFGNVIVDDVSA
jgi:hypothetical protein